MKGEKMRRQKLMKWNQQQKKPTVWKSMKARTICPFLSHFNKVATRSCANFMTKTWNTKQKK